ncbi:MAG: NAD(P)/FAD-dependent oxidoreductase [Chloroflexota bacterium]|nr:NAD(P)/FAD-dependent oxidoreductase [Chloroflexota bacterium]
MNDVIVLGAGPAGSRVAHKLATQGHSVLVLEEHPQIGLPPHCAGIVSKECFDLFGLPKESIQRELRAVRLFPPQGEPFRVQKDAVQAYAVDRPRFDLLMAKQAQGAGASYLLGEKAQEIEVTGKGARVRTSSGATFEGRAAVIAAGFGSALTARLGLGEGKEYVIGAQTEVAAPGLEEMEVFFGRERAPGFFAWLIPTTPGKGRAGLFTTRQPRHYLESFLQFLAEKGKAQVNGGDVAYGGVLLRPLSRTSGDRVLVIGDAAGQVKPTTGGGVYLSLLCADLAAEALHRALQSGDLSSRSLSSYDRLWKDKLGSELRIGYYARRVYEHFDDRGIERVFALLRKGKMGQSLANQKDFSFDWHASTILKALGSEALGAALGPARSFFAGLRLWPLGRS